MSSILNKKISPVWGILVVLVLAGGVGAMTFYYLNQISNEVLVMNTLPVQQIIDATSSSVFVR